MALRTAGAGIAPRERLAGPRVAVPDDLLERLRSVCPCADDDTARADVARDWWPITIDWAMRGEVPALPAVVARPEDEAQVADLLALCHEAHVPVTPVAGRSGVCGASVPVFGGVALDLCDVAGICDVDDASLLARVRPGTFGPALEEGLRAAGVTLGHWPQSMDLSTVGGWIACRGAGQYSTRYGKIEDMVAGLRVALADGRVIATGGAGPRAATGPDLTQVFVGSEGTLGVITEATLRVVPVPSAEERQAWLFEDFTSGLEACRLVLRRGATPAVLRLYDTNETTHHLHVDGGSALVVLDEADPQVVRTTMDLVEQTATSLGAKRIGDEVVAHWLERRNDVSALGPSYEAGLVVDTVEVAARWSALPGLYRAVLDALGAVPGTILASAHQSHAYRDGACLYFTFVAAPDAPGAGDNDGAAAQAYYVAAWDAVMAATVSAGGTISHHHGIGINRARHLPAALGASFDVLADLKRALDPRGILNPGKLGLDSWIGEVHWP